MKKFFIVFAALWTMTSTLAYFMKLPHSALSALGSGFTVTFFLLLYFLPSITAEINKHPQYNKISTLNLLLGWTIIGWIGALIWGTGKKA